MILLAPFDADGIYLDKGMFLSTEMAQALSNQVRDGFVNFNSNMTSVYLPFETLGSDIHGSEDADIPHATIDTWSELGLPGMYQGEGLNKKKLIVFPMHGLGDQLYLAMALRTMVSKYSDVDVYMVKPSMKSSEQWYDYIYFDPFFHITGPVVTIEEMAGYDFFVDAEHFAHKKDYEGCYPPEFYLKYLFFNDSCETSNLRPVIGPFPKDNDAFKVPVNKLSDFLRVHNKPIVFLNPITTGRVRDIPVHAVLEFIELVKKDYALVVSVFNNESLADEINGMNEPGIVTTKGCIDTIDGLIFLLSKMDYVITSDSGITHLSEALEIPCGSVFNVVTPEERTGSYRFSEQMKVDFKIDGVCQTPCYVHALDDDQVCPGMAWENEMEQQDIFRRYAPCMKAFKGEYLVMLLEELAVKFPQRVKTPRQQEADRIIENNVFRKDVYDIIPEGSSRILDFGCHQAELLLRLKRDKQCTGLYGIEINEDSKDIFDRHLDKGWIMDLAGDDADLGQEYTSYFNYIIMHDVVEHLYDPWYVLEKLRKYLAPSGKLIVIVPNLQYWGILNEIINGHFPYGGGGLLNEDHIRWFTCGSLIELVMLAGYHVEYYQPIFPPNTDLTGYDDDRIRQELRLPPAEWAQGGEAAAVVKFQADLKKNYYFFLANKILLGCVNTDKPALPEKLTVGGLQKRKDKLNINFKCELS